jgi:hypothetical protein
VSEPLGHLPRPLGPVLYQRREARRRSAGVWGHWPVENKPRWSLDVIFREDAAQTGKGYAPCKPEYSAENGTCPPSGSPRPSGKKKMTGPQRRFTATMNPDYMFTVLFKK